MILWYFAYYVYYEYYEYYEQYEWTLPGKHLKFQPFTDL